MVRILTQENCTGCKKLEQFLENSNLYEDKIEYVFREKNEDLFNELVEKYNVMSTPTVITETGKVLPSANPSSMKVFMKMNKLA